MMKSIKFTSLINLDLDTHFGSDINALKVPENFFEEYYPDKKKCKDDGFEFGDDFEDDDGFTGA